jgi:hypothetical protein
MRVWILGLLLTGCEPMTPSGNPLAPAAVAKPIPELHPVAPKASIIEPTEEAVFTISSEDLHDAANGVEPPSKATEAPPPTAVAPSPPAVPTSPGNVSAQPAINNSAQALQWPVRLVTTVPRASPPRAILGLPNGKEIVVNPGAMVPELGLVVIAIAPGSAELARIVPVGDHATIQSITLQAQY